MTFAGDPTTKLPRVWTEDQLQVLGVSKDNQPVFEARLEKIDSLKLSDPTMFTEDEWKAMYKKVLSGDSTQIDIDIEGDEAELDPSDYASFATQDIYKDHKAIIDGLPKLIQQIQKIHEMQDILDQF